MDVPPGWRWRDRDRGDHAREGRASALHGCAPRARGWYAPVGTADAGRRGASACSLAGCRSTGEASGCRRTLLWRLFPGLRVRCRSGTSGHACSTSGGAKVRGKEANVLACGSRGTWSVCRQEARLGHQCDGATAGRASRAGHGRRRCRVAPRVASHALRGGASVRGHARRCSGASSSVFSSVFSRAAGLW